MGDRVSQTAYATSRGVSRQAINKLISEGKIFVDEEGRVDPDVADAQLSNLNVARSKAARNMHAAAGASAPAEPVPGAKPPSDGARYNRAKADREEAAAQREQMELAKDLGLLLNREEAERGLFEAARMLRDQVLNVPKRMSGDLAGMTDPVAIDQKLAAELRRAFEAFGKMAIKALGGTTN